MTTTTEAQPEKPSAKKGKSAKGAKGKKTSNGKGMAPKPNAILQAAQRLIRSHFALDQVLSKLKEVRAEWNERIKDARTERADAIVDAKAVTPTGSPVDAKLVAVGKAYDSMLAAEAKARSWSKKAKEASATMVEAIEDPVDTSKASKAEVDALTRITLAHQEVAEAIAGKKDALHVLIEDEKEKSAQLNKQVEGARQLQLFD